MPRNANATSGPLLPAIFRLAWPAASMMLLQGFYNYIDTYFVGRIGPDALGGISTGAFVLWMTFAFSQLASVGIGAKIARRIGENNEEEADRTALRGVIYATVWAAIMGGVLYVAAPYLFQWMHTPPGVTEQGLAYLTPLIMGMPLIALAFMFNSIFAASGDTRTPFLIMLLSLLLNAVLDPLLIFGLAGFPELGIAGASWATIIARGLWILLAFRRLTSSRSHIRLRTHGRLGLDVNDILTTVRIGAPKALTGSLFSGVYIALTRITSAFGTPNIAALRIGHIYEGMSFLSALGFSIAASTLVGQNLGAGQPRRAAKAAWTSAGIVASFTAAVGLVFYLFPDQLGSVFSRDGNVISAAALYLTILALSQPFMGVEIVLEGSFAGAGNTVPPMIVQLPLTLMRYPVAYVLAFHTNLGVAGVWWAISGSSVLKCVALAWWFGRGRWAKTVV